MWDGLGNVLAPFNATLNLTSSVLLVAGFLFIRGRNAHQHQRAMTGAILASSLFLALYLLRFSLTGTHRIAAEGLVRRIYLAVLFSHMILAVVIIPLVLRLLYLVRKSRFHDHARLARWTFPIWLYVSLTGLLVYALLYHIVGYS